MSSAAEQEAVQEAAGHARRREAVLNGAPRAAPPAAGVAGGADARSGARFRTGPDGAAGTNFALWAGRRGGRGAVPLRRAGPGAAETRAPLTELTHGIWHGFVPGVRPGQRYGYRVHGRWDPWTGARWNPAKLLLDPYARAVDGEFALPPGGVRARAGLAAAARRRHRARRAGLRAPRPQGRRRRTTTTTGPRTGGRRPRGPTR